HLTVTRSPRTTSFSMKQRSQTLQSFPIRAPARMLTKAQMRVPSPICVDATKAVGCLEITAPSLSSEVVGPPLAVERDGALQTLAQGHARLPAQQLADARDVRDEVAGLLRLALGRELGELDARAGNELAEDRRDLEERRGSVVADVEHLPDGA